MTERRIMILAVVASALLLLTGWLWLRPAGGDVFADCRRSAVAGGTEALGGPFTLTDETGARVTDAQVFDRPSIFYMGYTYCPDVCPDGVVTGGYEFFAVPRHDPYPGQPLVESLGAPGEPEVNGAGCPATRIVVDAGRKRPTFD